jgi:hypothetical protein
MDATLPDWLAPSPPESQRRSKPERELERTQFEIALDFILGKMSEGLFLASAVREYPIELDYGRLLAWIMRDPERKQRYYEAQELGNEFIVAKVMDMDGSQSIIPEEVNLARLNFDKVKWHSAIVNKRRYATTQQIEINQNISIVAALAAANGRLIEHEQTKLIEGSVE